MVKKKKKRRRIIWIKLGGNEKSEVENTRGEKGDTFPEKELAKFFSPKFAYDLDHGGGEIYPE